MDDLSRLLTLLELIRETDLEAVVTAVALRSIGQVCEVLDREDLREADRRLVEQVYDLVVASPEVHSLILVSTSAAEA